MLKPEFTGQFKRDYKLAIKRGFNPKKLEEVIILLCNEQPSIAGIISGPRPYKFQKLQECTRMPYRTRLVTDL